MNSYAPAEVFPAGETIKDELEERGWTQADLAEILGRPVSVVNEIITGKTGITPETAVGLAAAFEGTNPKFWLNLDAAYQLAQIREQNPTVSQRARVYSAAPIREMIKRNWIEPSNDLAVLEQRLAAFLEVPSLDIEPTPWPHAARRSTSYAELNRPTIAWLMRVRRLAETIPARPYSASRLSKAIADLQTLTWSRDEARNVPRILNEAGIRFLIVEPLAKTRIDGACLWLNENAPVVALSLRYDRIDYFWHTLMHEIGHVANRDGLTNENAPVDVDLVGDRRDADEERPEFERKADEFAVAMLVPQHELQNFINRTRPLYSRNRIVNFAKRLRVHPGIVVGQLQFRAEISYRHSRDLLERIKATITNAAPTDGWGHRMPAN